MSKEEEERSELLREIHAISAEIASVKKLLLSETALANTHYHHTLQDLLAALALVRKSDYVCADPHGSWDGHLPGAYDEGSQIRAVLESENRTVTMDRHPVTKNQFLAALKDKAIVHLAGHGGTSGGQVIFNFDDGNAYPSDISSLTSVPSTLFYAGVCLGAANDTMAQAFRGNGTSNYVGFTKPIPDWGAKYFDDLVYEKWLVEGKSLSTALDEADDLYPALNCWVLWN